jgi:hypothetical protein
MHLIKMIFSVLTLLFSIALQAADYKVQLPTPGKELLGTVNIGEARGEICRLIVLEETSSFYKILVRTAPTDSIGQIFKVAKIEFYNEEVYTDLEMAQKFHLTGELTKEARITIRTGPDGESLEFTLLRDSKIAVFCIGLK